MGVVHMPRYYAVNDRPVKMVATPEGGADILVLDMVTGAFVPDRSYFLRISEVGKDVDSLHEDQFHALVATIRNQIAEKRLAQSIVWHRTGDGELPYAALLDGRAHCVRVNDFPAEPLYSLLVEGEWLADLEDWPANWVKPPAM